MINPCKNCQKREIGCHGKCPEYKEYQSEREKLLEWAHDYEDKDYEFFACQKKREGRKK